MIKILILSVTCLFLTRFLPADELNEIASAKEAFHHNLHEVEEHYLVCYHTIQKEKWAKDWDKLIITGTIVRVYRGKLAIGDQLTFERVMDGKIDKFSHLVGRLFFVPRYKSDDGKMEVDPQDPAWIFPWSEEYHKLAIEHLALTDE